MELGDYLDVLYGRRWVILLTFCLAILAATAITLATTPIYVATASIRVSPPIIGTVDYAEMLYLDRVINTQIKILTSSPVMDTVASRLNIPRSGLEQKIKVEAVRNTELIKIVAEDPNPDTAQGIASTLATLALGQNQHPVGSTSVQETLAEQLDNILKQLMNAREVAATTRTPITGTEAFSTQGSNVRALEETYAMLLREYEQSRVRETIRANSTSIVEPARVSPVPIKPNVQQNIALGGILGFLAGIGIAFLAEGLDKAIRTVDHLEHQLGVSVLGAIPRFRPKLRLKFWNNGQVPQIVMRNPAERQAAEYFRVLRARLRTPHSDKPWKTLLFTSANPGEGKSTIAANLAVVSALAKQKVLLVDADFSRPSVHKAFGLTNFKGLSQALSREHPASSFLKSTETEGLMVLTSGPPPSNPDALLDSARVRDVLTELAQAFDMILVDGPPVLAVADVSLIASLFDGVVVVTAYNRTSSKALREIVAQMQGVGANVVGTVLNGFKPTGAASYYDYRQRQATSPGKDGR